MLNINKNCVLSKFGNASIGKMYRETIFSRIQALYTISFLYTELYKKKINNIVTVWYWNSKVTVLGKQSLIDCYKCINKKSTWNQQICKNMCIQWLLIIIIL